MCSPYTICISFFFFNDTAPTEIYTLSLHDALPISDPVLLKKMYVLRRILNPMGTMDGIDFLLDKLRSTKSNSEFLDRKSTRLNSSHANISYAVFCLKKKNTSINDTGNSNTVSTYII